MPHRTRVLDSKEKYCAARYAVPHEPLPHIFIFPIPFIEISAAPSAARGSAIPHCRTKNGRLKY